MCDSRRELWNNYKMVYHTRQLCKNLRYQETHERKIPSAEKIFSGSVPLASFSLFTKRATEVYWDAKRTAVICLNKIRTHIIKYKRKILRKLFTINTKGRVKAKLLLCLTKHHTMKTYVGVEIQLHAFLTSGLDGGE
jgi:predicted PolB exonuclease-like 3'-5' exonuclease